MYTKPLVCAFPQLRGLSVVRNAALRPFVDPGMSYVETTPWELPPGFARDWFNAELVKLAEEGRAERGDEQADLFVKQGMLYIRLFERWCKENNLCIASKISRAEILNPPSSRDD